eukprot:2965306-Rhodomonas_salina.1
MANVCIVLRAVRLSSYAMSGTDNACAYRATRGAVLKQGTCYAVCGTEIGRARGAGGEGAGAGLAYDPTRSCTVKLVLRCDGPARSHIETRWYWRAGRVLRSCRNYYCCTRITLPGPQTSYRITLPGAGKQRGAVRGANGRGKRPCACMTVAMCGTERSRARMTLHDVRYRDWSHLHNVRY